MSRVGGVNGDDSRVGVEWFGGKQVSRCEQVSTGGVGNRSLERRGNGFRGR